MIPKFRAWHIIDKKMISWKRLLNGHNLRNVFMRPEMCNLKLMQSTGLKDKNGIEIFEGDILHRKVHVILLGTDLNKWVDEYAYVEWKYGGWHVGEDLLEFVLEEGIDHHTRCKQTALEVIGNIYENPDLLDSDLVEVER